MNASLRSSRLRSGAVSAAGAFACALAACSLGFQDDGLAREGAAAGSAGATSGEGAAGGAAGAKGGAAGAGAGGAGGAGGPGGASGAAGANGAAGAGGGGGGTEPPVSLEGCVLLLNMDEPEWVGVDAVKDASGEGNDGTPVNAASTTAEGKFGRAGEFNGTNWVDVPDSASLGGALEALTYAAWVYPTEVRPDGSGIIAKREGFQLNAAFAMFLFEGNRLYADIQNVRFNSIVGLTLSQWHHVAVVFDGKHPDPTRRASMYLDGAFENSADVGTAIGPNSQSVLVGNLIGGGDRFLGRIDDVAIWTRALGSDEIKALYEANRPL